MIRLRRGFTLIELLLVIAIIVVVLTLTVPALMSVRRSALILGCQSNMSQISLMVQIYDQDHEALPYLFYASKDMLDPVHVDDVDPSTFGLAAIVDNPEILKCPADIGYGGEDYGLESGEVTCYSCFGHSYAFNNSAYTDPTSPYDIVSKPARFSNVEDKKDIIMLTDFSSVWHGTPGGNKNDSKYYLNIMYFSGKVEGKEFPSDQDAKKYRNDVSHRRWWKVPVE